MRRLANDCSLHRTTSGNSYTPDRHPDADRHAYTNPGPNTDCHCHAGRQRHTYTDPDADCHPYLYAVSHVAACIPGSHYSRSDGSAANTTTGAAHTTTIAAHATAAHTAAAHTAAAHTAAAHATAAHDAAHTGAGRLMTLAGWRRFMALRQSRAAAFPTSLRQFLKH